MPTKAVLAALDAMPRARIGKRTLEYSLSSGRPRATLTVEFSRLPKNGGDRMSQALAPHINRLEMDKKVSVGLLKNREKPALILHGPVPVIELADQELQEYSRFCAGLRRKKFEKELAGLYDRGAKKR